MGQFNVIVTRGFALRWLIVFGGCWFTHAAPTLNWVESNGFRSAEIQPGIPRKPGFTRMELQSTGVTFTNRLTGDAYATNAVAHNGAGLAIGDVDGDGWPDIYLCTLQGANELFRNLGDWRFERVEIGAAACAGQFSTGAVFADVDGDGDLDLLVTGIVAGTRLFLNDGHGHFSESTNTQLSRTGSTTSMALADIDGNGTLDLYCTHYIDEMHLADPSTRFGLIKRGDKWEVNKVNGESTRLPKWKDRFEASADGKVRELAEVDGFYRNDGHGGFTPMQFEKGIFMNDRGETIPPYRDYGLSVMFRDLNGDLAPDMYVCNDFPSPDRIWINSGHGTFRELSSAPLRHTSRSAMGIDFADINRDGWDDFIVVDMLARNPRKRLTQLVHDGPDPVAVELVRESPSYNRNTLFWGRPDGTFAETAFMAGVAASDWSWCPIFLDVDLDGYEDLLISNGFGLDVMDQDSNDRIRTTKLTPDQQRRVRLMHPGFATENAAFRNRRDGTFEPMSHEWGFHQEGISYGMAMADLDNDGDLDLVVNNLNMAASLYRNDAGAGRIQVRLRGDAPNTQGIGAKIQLVGGALTQSQEMICGGRYLSGDQAIRTFAADPDGTKPMRLEIRWRNGALSLIEGVQSNRIYEVYQSNSVVRPPVARTTSPPLFVDVSPLAGHSHVDEPFDEAGLQPMLPRRLSRRGPGIAWYDYDGDGWEDLIVAGGRGGRLAIYRNEGGKSFRKMEESTASPIDQGAVVGWPDGLGQRHLLAAVSSYGPTPGAESQVAIYSGTNTFERQVLPAGKASLGPLVMADIDGDGDLDLFVGGRFLPGRYPEPVSSTIWINDHGKFVPDAALSRPFHDLGMVSGATFTDIDGDGRPDLALAMEWGPVRIFHNLGGHFEEETAGRGLAPLTGWWTSVTTGDFDGDGRLDLACGNWGRNSSYELYNPSPLRVYYGNWIGDGVIQLMECWRNGDAWAPVRDRTWLSRGMPLWSERFPTHQSFSEATVNAILGTAHEKSAYHEANLLDSLVLLNRGSNYVALPLPRAAQLTPVFSINVGDADGDGRDDLFVAQNFYGAFADMSREDSGQGLWLRGVGDGTFTALDSVGSGILIMGEQRGAALTDFNHDGRVDLVVSQNNGPTRLYLNQGAKPGLRVILRGPPGNPEMIGAKMRVIYAGGKRGPCRLVQAGSGYWSQDGSTQVLGLAEPAIGLWIQWPGGREQTVPVAENTAEVRVDNIK